MISKHILFPPKGHIHSCFFDQSDIVKVQFYGHTLGGLWLHIYTTVRDPFLCNLQITRLKEFSHQMRQIRPKEQGVGYKFVKIYLI